MPQVPKQIFIFKIYFKKTLFSSSYRDPEPDLVVIMGNDEDNVLDCKDYLLNMAEEYEQEVIDKEQYTKPTLKASSGQEKKTKSDGFKVAKAP